MSKVLATKNVAAVLVVLALMVGTFAFATPAKAQSASDLQAQIQLLLAQIAALQGGSTPSGACFTFTMNLTVGSSNGEVMQAQKFLNSHGAMVAASGAGSVGNETMYFGARTKAAVAAFQAAQGISPAAGYWGPITRARVNAMCMPTTPTPTPGTPSPAPGGEVLNGTAGTANVTETSTDVEDTVDTGTTEKVLGIKIEASGADLRVTNLRVRFTYTGGTTPSDRLSNYASEISIWANGTKIGSMAASDFVRDSAGVYSASIPVSQVIRMGSGNKVTFHVGFTANTNIDSDDVAGTWTAALVQTRYTDPTGAVLFDTTGSIDNTGVNVERVSSSSDVTLRMGEGSSNPKAQNVKVSESNSTEIPLLEFTLKAEGTAMTFDRLIATTTITGETAVSDMVSDFFLMSGNQKLAEVAGSTGTNQQLTFNLDDTYTLAQNSTQTFRIVAKLKSITAVTSSGTVFDQGDTIAASTSVDVYNINAKADIDGKSVTDRAGSVTSYTQTLFSEGIQVAKVGESFTHNAQDVSASSTGEFKVTVRVTNFGSDDVYIPLNTSATTSIDTSFTGITKGVTYALVDSGGTATSTGASATLTRVSGGTELTNSVRISGGQSADFQLAVTFNPGLVATTGQWRVQLWSVGRATSDSATATSFVNATPAEDFRTSYYTVNN